jgi:signal transduction histidine kinase
VFFIVGFPGCLHLTQKILLFFAPEITPQFCIAPDEVGVLASTLNDLIGRVQLLLQEQQDGAAYQLSQIEQQLIESRKVSSMGQMIAGIASELSNPVNFILGNLAHAQTTTQHLLDVLALDIQETPVSLLQHQAQVEALDWDFVRQDLPQLFQSIQTGVNRVNQITMIMKDLSHVAADEKCHLMSVHVCLDNALLILRSRLKRRVNVVCQYGTIPKVEGYYSALYQVFTNILSNSIEALERAIDCEQVVCQEQGNASGDQQVAQITVTTECLDLNCVLIRIEDNGIGIPQQDQPQIFHSFFTTKPVNMGVGLGLTISQRIIQEKHGGQLMFASESGKGTTFSIHLPVSQSKRLPDDESGHHFTDSQADLSIRLAQAQELVSK